jgi:hypothetical protein
VAIVTAVILSVLAIAILRAPVRGPSPADARMDAAPWDAARVVVAQMPPDAFTEAVADASPGSSIRVHVRQPDAATDADGWTCSGRQPVLDGELELPAGQCHNVCLMALPYARRTMVKARCLCLSGKIIDWTEVTTAGLDDKPSAMTIRRELERIGHQCD